MLARTQRGGDDQNRCRGCSMSAWLDRLLRDFLPELSRLWIVDDPDGVLLDGRVLAELRARGFDLLPFDDSIAFRLEYESRYRSRGGLDPARALILHARSGDTSSLPWDYLRESRSIRLSLSDLFPKLAPSVVRQLGAEHFETLYAAQASNADQVLGESATKDFALTHVFRISPYLLTRVLDFWRELLRLHYRGDGLPEILARHMTTLLSRQDAFKSLPIAELLESRSFMLRLVQNAWVDYLENLGVTGDRVGDPVPTVHLGRVAVPFDDPDIRSIIDSLFMDGSLHPLRTGPLPISAPAWVSIGVIQDVGSQQDLVREGILRLGAELPTEDASHRDWIQFSRGLGEITSRLHSLDNVRADGVREAMSQLQQDVDARLQDWIRRHYADLPSLPASKAPVMVHHIARHLALRKSGGESRIALLVFDGLAVDQWARIREHMIAAIPAVQLEESACFAWLPTLTSVSRQAIFSGLRPRDFAASIESTSQEPALWTRFWMDQGLRANEVMYRKAVRHLDQLDALKDELAAPSVKVAGIVVDMVDEIVHGATMGKRGVARQIDHWCETGFVDRLIRDLSALGYHIYLTADHGNVDAVGMGRPNQGVTPELRGERVRTYRSRGLREDTARAHPGSIAMDVSGLPDDFLPLFAGFGQAFLTPMDQVVVHGGPSIEELLVPFVKIGMVG